ncbi:MAG: hypothetical protein H0W72_15375 [Planctomycetes bacterium]|nr:hypothetical protein [Planctomycetota bacterium]
MLTIDEDDQVGRELGAVGFSTLRFAQVEASGADTQATITVVRGGGAWGAISVGYVTSDGTAQAGTDYSAARGTLSWAHGDTAPKTFTVTVTGDTAAEGDETVNLELSAIAGAIGAPRAAVLTIVDPATAAAPAAAAVIGSIVREFWIGLPGDSPDVIPHAAQPHGIAVLTSLAGPTGWGVDYATRISGHLIPPVTGSYTFWIAADDQAELWLSPDAQATSRVRIARVTSDSPVAPRAWNVQPDQRSAEIALEGGRRYYFQVVHKQASGGDHLAVGWLKPGQSGSQPSEIIPGSALSEVPPGIR